MIAGGVTGTAVWTMRIMVLAKLMATKISPALEFVGRLFTEISL
jgi:hypothetical protein